MTAWNWLTKPPYTWSFVRNVVIKGLALFVLVNLAFALLKPLPLLGQISIYNSLIPGRPRLPYGENPEQSYNLSLQSLEAMFASHEINGVRKAADEYRVLLIGDSAVWGVLLNPDQTLAGQLNAAGLRTSDGKRVRAYNLGYPVQSLTKDLLILQYAMRYAPDLVIWLFTPESFPPDQQLITLLVRENPAPIRALIARYKLNIDPADPSFIEPSFLEQTIVGQRRALADLLRLQLYGLTWNITAHDQTYPRFYEPRMEDFGTDVQWHGFAPGTLSADKLAFDVIGAGVSLVSEKQTPILLINEPIFISRGVNSNLRYDFFYPRWLFDRFRELMAAQSQSNGWAYLDLWNIIPASEFTDSAVHLTPAGSSQLAGRVGAALLQIANRELNARR
jgi:hypothetical protein